MVIARLTLILALLLCTVAGRAQTFNFAWPAPSEGTVNWTIQADEITLVNESDITFTRRSDEAGFALVTQRQELVRVLGVSKEQERAMLGDPQWILAMSLWPTYLISEQGELEGLADLDLVTMNLIASADDVTDAEKARRFVRSDRFRQAVREQVTILWEGLVGAIAGITLAPGKSLTESDAFPVHGVMVPVRVSITHLGSAQDVKGAVRLRITAVFDEAALKTVMSRTLSDMLPRKTAGAVRIEHMSRQIRVDSVMAPDTLLPHFARISEEVVTQAVGHEPVTSKQVQTFEFSWGR